MTALKWYFRFPGEFHALGPVKFDKPIGIREARRRLRIIYMDCDDCNFPKPLPRGTEVWPA